MEEQLISFETAILAKEKGFDGNCTKVYVEQYEVIDHTNKHILYKNVLYPFCLHKITNKDLTSIVKRDNVVATAPTQSLLQKWIRETHKIYVTALPSYTDGSDNKKHYFELFYGKTLRLFGDKYSYFPTYEEALEVGLFEALNLIKNE